MNIPDFLIERETELSFLRDDELSAILEFKKRAEEFDIAMRRYYKGAISSCQIADDIDIKKSTFKANTPDLEHIEYLALKFRFFYAEKEPTRFERIIGILRRNAKDEWAKNYIDRLRALYINAMKNTRLSSEMGYSVSNREIINLWFNSEFFHSDIDKRERLQFINTSISGKVSLFQLYTAISGVSNQINSLYAVVHQVSNDCCFIYTPNHHFSSAEAGQ
ncbi:TPA: hypothetical protein ACGFXT_003440, partial [Vibrio cholerae]